MTATSPAERFGPEARTTLYYATILSTMGVVTGYGAIWLAAQGLSSAQIGWINAAPVFVILCLNLAVGRIADRASDWRGIIVGCAWVAAIVPVGLYLVEGFWPILLVWTATSVALGVSMPVSDAATLKMTQRRGTEYGPIRAAGTVGYLVALVIIGYAAEAWGTAAYLPVFLAFALSRALTALALPRFRAAPGEDIRPGPSTLREILRPWFVLPLLGASVVFGSHIILNIFQALLWERQGIALGTIGLLIAFGAVCETLMMLFWGRVRRMAPARWLLAGAGTVAVLRWIAMAFAPEVAWLWPLQALHGITFGVTLMASLAFVNQHTTERIAAQAQGFFMMLQQGMSVLALTGFGALADAFGAASYFASAVFASLGVCLVLISLKLRPPAG
ncbi:MFS transporter [Wenxinia marina]|uniref:Nitrate/nitrite transporter n=1 Tax=Wenxinia marina DSM 24838 TaxID=1123501 RepID=A0A0D0PA65_9RHOB|nr:MFS transporter [Wenxinia marina]KIQ68401.1 Nitrate/nitrite transporter [Wenxinia marina DSM 24838]GGL72496.1 MFS transporter [Wenxinia marina]